MSYTISRCPILPEAAFSLNLEGGRVIIFILLLRYLRGTLILAAVLSSVIVIWVIFVF